MISSSTYKRRICPCCRCFRHRSLRRERSAPPWGRDRSAWRGPWTRLGRLRQLFLDGFWRLLSRGWAARGCKSWGRMGRDRRAGDRFARHDWLQDILHRSNVNCSQIRHHSLAWHLWAHPPYKNKSSS